jgi:hypothetical protein
MALVPFQTIDYTEQARERVTEAFKGKQVFDNYVQILTKGEIDLQNTFKDLLQLRDIDSATGAQLDIIGRIVGQDRELIAADLYDFFGMIGALNAFPMGDTNDPSVGGIFYSYGIDLGGNVELDDETYRIFIRAKIFKNITASTPEQFIQAIKLIFGLDQLAVVAEGDASVTVLLGGQLSNFQRVLLTYISYSQGYPSRLVPKTVGVRINFGEYIPNGYFGFQDSPGALGFGDISGTYGYGLGYGLNYGQSDYTTNGGGVMATIY